MRYAEKATIYRHYKGGHYYVLDLAEHTEIGELMVIYHDLYTDEALTYVMPLEMFLSEVEEGKENSTGQKYKFEKVDYTY